MSLDGLGCLFSLSENSQADLAELCMHNIWMHVNVRGWSVAEGAEIVG
jgi:hypothetical protein